MNSEDLPRSYAESRDKLRRAIERAEQGPEKQPQASTRAGNATSGASTDSRTKGAVRPDLSNEEIEAMHDKEEGSAREYLRLRREELEAEKQAKREADDYRRYERAYVHEGGTRDGAKEAYARGKNEQAERAVADAEREALEYGTREAMRSV